MKQLALLGGLTLLLSASAMGEGMSFGVLGGINLANVSADSLDDNEIRTGISGGVFLDMPLTPCLSLQPQLLYVMQGAKVDDDDMDIGMKLGYFDIPVLAKYSIPMAGAFSPNLFLGPFLGFNLSADAYVNDETEDISDNVESMDYGLMLGGGFDIPVGTGDFIFDARYILGLSNINADPDSTDT